MAGIYIHIPFCKQACSYCDFYFSTRQQLRAPFVDRLVQEIEGYTGTKYSNESFSTLYIGGGTPSLLSGLQLRRIVSAVYKTFKTDFKEVTMELNPDDITPEYLHELLDAGINRASMGVQSFDEELLTFMHRAHTKKEAIYALKALSSTGFPSFTADLIYGNPEQSLETLENDIQQLLEFNPPHISAYSLTIEPDTRLGKQVDLGRIKPPDDDRVATHFDLMCNTLSKNGIKQYEVSNFALPGKEAIHNSNYWTHKNYLGLGPSAHSFWWDGGEAKRWNNVADLKSYLTPDTSPHIRENIDFLDKQTLAEERLMLSLRTREGISLSELKNKYHYSLSAEQQQWIEMQKKHQTIEDSNNHIRCTQHGLKISDLLVVDLLSKQ